MMMKKTQCSWTTYALLLLVLLSSCARTLAQEASNNLIMRYVWAPLFCFSGSKNSVPKEYCGEDPETALPRFRAHRLARLQIVGRRECNATEEFDYYSLPDSIRKSLECKWNSYTKGNTDEYIAAQWNDYGACFSEELGMGPEEYFSLVLDISKRYDVDQALKNWNLELKNFRTFYSQNYLTLLETEFGKKGFFTCDKASQTKYSTFTICLEGKAPFKITECSESQLSANDSECPSSMIIERGNGSEDVTEACLVDFPSFAMPDLF